MRRQMHVPYRMLVPAIIEETTMPWNRPRFLMEIVILGFALVFGMAFLREWLPAGWGFIVRVIYSGALFGLYALHYDRTWGSRSSER